MSHNSNQSEKNRPAPIKSVLLRSLFFPAIMALIILIITSIDSNYRTIKAFHTQQIQVAHRLLDNLLAPQLAISNDAQVKVLLERASTSDQWFAVSDANHVVLLGNDAYLPAVESVMNPHAAVNCQNLLTHQLRYQSHHYAIGCTHIDASPLLTQPIGILLSFSKMSFEPLFPEVAYLAVIGLLIIAILIIYLKCKIDQEVIQPMSELKSRVDFFMRRHLSEITHPVPTTSSYVFKTREFSEIEAFLVQLIKSSIETSFKHAQMKQSEALSALARQVAHDLNNYLYQLNYRISALTTWSETEREAIFSLVLEMDMMAKRLLEKYRITRHPESTQRSKSTDNSGSKLESNGCIESKSGLASQLEPELDSQLNGITEPLMHVSILSQFSKLQQMIEIQCHSMGLELKVSGLNQFLGDFIQINPTEFRRVFLNIVHNAIEANSVSKIIFLRCIRQESRVLIEIEDDGCGIPAHILEKLGSEEITYGKKNGNGIGIYHASRILKNFGGSLHIDSQVSKGTVVRMTIPLSRPPLWHITSLGLKNIKTIVIIDDNPAIHDAWALRFKAFPHISLQHFDSFFKATTSTESCSSHETLYLVDYQIQKEYVNGIDYISSQGLVKQAILVTGHSESPEVISACTLYRLYMLPKEELDFLVLNSHTVFIPWSDQ